MVLAHQSLIYAGTSLNQGHVFAIVDLVSCSEVEIADSIQETNCTQVKHLFAFLEERPDKFSPDAIKRSCDEEKSS